MKEAMTESRFNLSIVKKPHIGGKFNKHPKLAPFSVRLTTKQFIVGSELRRQLMKGLKKSVASVTVRIEKDVEGGAVRLTRVPANSSYQDTFHLNASKPSVLYTTRPRALFDMSNGNYLEDHKEANVFVLEG